MEGITIGAKPILLKIKANPLKIKIGGSGRAPSPPTPSDPLDIVTGNWTFYDHSNDPTMEIVDSAIHLYSPDGEIANRCWAIAQSKQKVNVNSYEKLKIQLHLTRFITSPSLYSPTIGLMSQSYENDPENTSFVSSKVVWCNDGDITIILDVSNTTGEYYAGVIADLGNDVTVSDFTLYGAGEYTDISDISPYVGYSWSVGSWDESGITEITANSLRLNDYIDISDIGNTLYAEAYDTLGTELQNCFAAYDAQKNFISYINGWQPNKTVTTLPQNTKFIRLIIARSRWTDITVSDMGWCQLVKGTSIS